MASATTRASKQRTEIRLDLEGMTCASCAARVERKLNKLEGVDATVNFATEQATVHCDTEVPVERLVAAVESAGYGARPPASADRRHDADAGHHGRLAVVDGRARWRVGYGHLFRGRRHGHDVDRAWPLPGGARQGPLLG